MNTVRKFIARLLFPRWTKFTEAFRDCMVRAVRETERFDDPVRDVSLTWLAVTPYSYFNGLFLESENYSEAFVALFEKSNMTGAEECFQITQAYCLYHLLLMLGKSSESKELSVSVVRSNVHDRMVHGEKILSMTDQFQTVIENVLAPEDIAMCYVERILEIQYPEKPIRDNVLSAVRMDSQAMLGLSIFTTESLVTAKHIDSRASEGAVH